MTNVTVKQIIEGLLMACQKPLRLEELHQIINHNAPQPIELATLGAALQELAAEYQDRGLELKEVASGWRFQVRANLSPWINRLYEEQPPKYSRALLETLAIIAYRQPITRAEIEEIRGVTVSSNIIKTLLEHDWVKIVGHKEVPGRPALFATTKKFLDHFNLKKLQELPALLAFTETPLPELSPAASANETPPQAAAESAQMTNNSNSNQNNQL